MSWIWEFRKDGVYIKREITDELIGKRTIEDKKSYEELSKLDGLEITIKTPIEPVIEDGVLKAIRMYITSYKKVERERGLEEISESVKQEKELPEYILVYQRQIETEGTLPNTIRDIIKEKRSISDKDLKDELIRRGYTGRGGSIGATIRVLKLRGEVEVVGRGKNKVYRWIGS